MAHFNIQSKRQQRVASKTYRNRKKELENELSDRIITLEKENRVLLQHTFLCENLIHKLNNENIQIRHFSTQMNEV